MLSPSATWIAIHSLVSAMDGWLILWKIKIAVMIAPAIAVKIMSVFYDGFILLTRCHNIKKPQS